MSDGNIVPLWARDPARAREHLRTVAQDSARVFFTAHARQRMRERRISTSQVLRCLRHGNVIEGPAPNPRGNWEVLVEVLSAGDVIRVAAALDQEPSGHFIVVITAYHP